MSIAKNEKAGLAQRAKRLFRGMISELKKVHWPGRKELVAYTTVVLLSVFLVGTVIWIVDSGVGFVMNFLIK